MQEQQYENESQCEDYVDYKVEGYHPVVLGEKFKSIYTVVQKLGWGHFSTVWLAFNETNKQNVALKIQKSKQCYTQSAIDELQILGQIRKHQQNPKWTAYLQQIQKTYPQKVNARLCRPLLLLDSFPHHGIHGKHMCSVFELMGPNLLDLIQHFQFKDKRMPLWLVKKITRDVLLGLVYLHEHCNIIHTDLKPQNIMMKLQQQDEKQLIEQIKSYKVKPLSMKYLRNLQASKNPKNKKKQEKKKLKKKKLQQGQQNKDENKNENEHQEQISQPSSNGKLGLQSNSLSVAQIQPPSLSSQLQKQQSKLESEVVVSQSLSHKQSESQSSSIHPHGHDHNHEGNKKEMISSNKQQNGNSDGLGNGDGDKKHNSGEGDIDMTQLRWKNVIIQLRDTLYFKIADMGNACYTHKHFSDDIQTREYRSPQVLIGHDYSTNTDIFSLGCTVYQMLTNNFLFKPKKIPGIKKNEDHMYQMIEALGPIDKDYATSGSYSSQIFNKKGKLINGNPKVHYPISRRLFQKQGYDPELAVAIQDFLLPMLAYDPKDRCDARTCLKSQWLWK